MEASISTFAPICIAIRGKSIKDAERSSHEGGENAKKSMSSKPGRGTSNGINQ